jgi:hypothetical protein
MTNDLRSEASSKGHRARTGTALVALLAIVMTIVEVLAVPSSHAVSPPTRVAVADSMGDALRLTAPLLPSVLQPAQADLAWSTSSIDGNGIGLGTNVADGSAKPVSAVINAIENLTIGQSDTTAPPADQEVHSIACVQPTAAPGCTVVPGGFAFKVGYSLSKSDLVPTSENQVTIASLNTDTTSLMPLLKTSNLASYAKANSVPTAGDPNSTANANSHVTLTNLNLAGLLTLDITVANATAAATATGGAGSSATTDCGPLSVTAKLAGIPISLPLFTCNGMSLDLLGLVKLTAGKTNAGVVALPNEAHAAITSLRIDVLSGVNKGIVLELGKAEANASFQATTPTNGCGTTNNPPDGVQGNAQGVAAFATANITSGGPVSVRADVSRSDSVIDEGGILGTSKGAMADGRMVRLQSFQPPGVYNLDGTLIPAHSDAPPNKPAVNNTIVGISAPILGTTATVLQSTASSSTAGNNALSDGHAAATNSAATAVVTNPLSLPLTLTDKTIYSTASSDKSGAAGATSSATSGIEKLTTNLAGLAIEVNALQSNADVSANNTPGGATANADYKFVSIKIGSQTFTVKPAFGTSVTVAGLLKVTFGNRTLTPDASGQKSTASIDALTIETINPLAGLAKVKLVVGHSEATVDTTGVTGGASGVICKDVDIHYDGNSFGDSGGTVAPHQKFNYKVCVASTGGQTLTGVTWSDVIDNRLLVISSPGLTLTGATEDGHFYPYGGTLTLTEPVDIPAGQTLCWVFIVEAKPDTPTGSVIGNTATFTSTNGGGGTSNNVTVIVGYAPGQPALWVEQRSFTFDGVETLTLNLTIHNYGLGTAYSPRIDNYVDKFGLTAIGPLPTFPDMAPGSSIDFTMYLHVPQGVQQFYGDVREVGYDAQGRPYAFDSVPLNAHA